LLDEDVLNIKFCNFCGKKIEKGKDTCPKCGKFVISKKIKPYLLTKAQFTVVKKKLLPLFFVSILIWILTGIYLGGIFKGILSPELFSNLYLTLIICNIQKLHQQVKKENLMEE